EPVFLENATLEQIQTAIVGAEVFHFAGHGMFSRQMGDLPGTYTGVGSLALEDQFVGAEQLGINLRGNGVRLAVLGGCETGGRDWGVMTLYLRDADGQIFGGASDDAVRRQAQQQARATIDLRVQEVAAGGKLLGAQVGQISQGSLAVTVTVGTAAGDVTGAKI